MRFVKENAIVDKFLFCQEMKGRTSAKDVFDLVNAFLRENSIAWNKVGLVCTDGAPAMIRKEHQYLLFHTKVRWLSRGCAMVMLSRVAELVIEVAVFFFELGSVKLATLFHGNRFQLKVFYLADIFRMSSVIL